VESFRLAPTDQETVELMHLQFHAAFAAMGVVAATTGGVCVLLASQGLSHGEGRAIGLLLYGIVAIGVGAGTWIWARRSRPG